MTVLISESLETLQKWVVELFSEVKEGGHGRLSIHCEGRIWEPNLLYHVAAGNEQSLVSINFPLPCLENAYLTKPHDYCGHIIGHGTLKPGPSNTLFNFSFSFGARSDVIAVIWLTLILPQL